MNTYFRAWLGLAVGALLVTSARSADPKPGPAPKPPVVLEVKAPAAPADVPKPGRTLNGMKLPADAILVICKEARNALDIVPTGFLLSPEKYQELLDQIEALRRQLKPARPEVPSGSCKLTSGQVEGDVVRFQALFDFRTERPKALVTFGCQRAWLRSASLDGHLPPFATAAADDGVVIQVDSVGVHQLTLDLALPLNSRGTKGGERGFDLGLPGVAISNLEQFTVPAAVPEVRINGRSVKTRPVDGQHSRVESITLGKVDRLEMSWKGPAPAPAKGRPLLTADGKVTVRVDEKTVTTDVELTLQSLRGEAKQWRILVPPQFGFELKEPLPQDEHIESKDLPTPKEPWLTIRLREPSAEPLRVSFQISQPRKGGLVPVGPFTVLDTFRQRGTILVRAPSDIRLRLHPRGETKEREVTEEMRRDKVVSALNYWNVAAPANPAQPGPPLLDLEVEVIKGAVETRVEHTLQQVDHAFLLTTRIEATPVRMGIEQIELLVPPDYARHYDRDRGAAPASLVEEVVFDEKRSVVVIRLAEKQSFPFTVTLPALYPVAPGEKQLMVELPRPVPGQTLDRGGQTTVQMAEGHALVVKEPGPEGPGTGSRKHVWHWERAPARVEFAWHDYRPEFPVESVADVTLLGAQARVRQQIEFQFPGPPPAFVMLHVPKVLDGHVQIQGGSLAPEGLVRLERPARTVTLVLSYHSPTQPVTGGKPPRPEAGSAYVLPLVRPRQGTRIETKVRLWGEPGAQVQAVDAGTWDPLPAEVRPEKDSLPILVLRSSNPQATLTLVQRRAEESPLAPVVIERALVQVATVDDGYQSYRARFLLTRIGVNNLDLEMPAPLASLKLEVWLDGKKVSQVQTLDAAGKVVENGKILRLGVEPDLYQKPVILDLRYQVPPGRAPGNHSFRSTFYPPVPRGEVFLGRVRWQVAMPSGWLALFLDSGFRAEERWEWRGGLLAPRPTVASADLERWLGSAPLDDLAAEDAGLVCSRASLEPLSIFQVPQQGWLLVCSVLFIGLGLGLAFARVPRRFFWATLAILGLLAAYVSLTWPSVVPAFVYGCEPGAAVLLLIFAIQWMLQKHYRRQVVFLPGFTRVKPNSTLLRDNAQVRARGEPSTVDGPRKRESSIGKGGIPQG